MLVQKVMHLGVGAFFEFWCITTYKFIWRESKDRRMRWIVVPRAASLSSIWSRNSLCSTLITKQREFLCTRAVLWGCWLIPQGFLLTKSSTSTCRSFCAKFLTKARYLAGNFSCSRTFERTSALFFKRLWYTWCTSVEEVIASELREEPVNHS